MNAAKGVIICTGGYGASNGCWPIWLPATRPGAPLRDSVTETGDGIRMALWAGASAGRRRLHDLEPRHSARRLRVQRGPHGRRHLPARQPALPARERERRALHERGSVLSHELRRRREPAEALQLDRLGRQLLGRHRPVRHLLLSLVPGALRHRLQR